MPPNNDEFDPDDYAPPSEDPDEFAQPSESPAPSDTNEDGDDGLDPDNYDDPEDDPDEFAQPDASPAPSDTNDNDDDDDDDDDDDGGGFDPNDYDDPEDDPDEFAQPSESPAPSDTNDPDETTSPNGGSGDEDGGDSKTPTGQSTQDPTQTTTTEPTVRDLAPALQSIARDVDNPQQVDVRRADDGDATLYLEGSAIANEGGTISQMVGSVDSDDRVRVEQTPSGVSVTTVGSAATLSPPDDKEEEEEEELTTEEATERATRDQGIDDPDTAPAFAGEPDPDLPRGEQAGDGDDDAPGATGGTGDEFDDPSEDPDPFSQVDAGQAQRNIEQAKGGEVSGTEIGGAEDEVPTDVQRQLEEQLESQTVTDLEAFNIQVERTVQDGKVVVEASLSEEARREEQRRRRELASQVNKAGDRAVAGINRRAVDAFTGGEGFSAADEVLAERQLEQQLKEQTGADLEAGDDFVIEQTEEGFEPRLTDSGQQAVEQEAQQQAQQAESAAAADARADLVQQLDEQFPEADLGKEDVEFETEQTGDSTRVRGRLSGKGRRKVARERAPLSDVPGIGGIFAAGAEARVDYREFREKEVKPVVDEVLADVPVVEDALDAGADVREDYRQFREEEVQPVVDAAVGDVDASDVADTVGDVQLVGSATEPAPTEGSGPTVEDAGEAASGGVTDAAESDAAATVGDIQLVGSATEPAPTEGGGPEVRDVDRESAATASAVGIASPEPISTTGGIIVGGTIVGGAVVARELQNRNAPQADIATVAEIEVPENRAEQDQFEIETPEDGGRVREIEVPMEPGETVTAGELGLPEEAFQEQDGEIPVSSNRDDVVISDGEIELPAGTTAVAAQERYEEEEEEADEEGEDDDGEEEEVIVEVPEEFIPEETVTVGTGEGAANEVAERAEEQPDAEEENPFEDEELFLPEQRQGQDVEYVQNPQQQPKYDEQLLDADETILWSEVGQVGRVEPGTAIAEVGDQGSRERVFVGGREDTNVRDLEGVGDRALDRPATDAAAQATTTEIDTILDVQAPSQIAPALSAVTATPTSFTTETPTTTVTEQTPVDTPYETGTPGRGGKPSRIRLPDLDAKDEEETLSESLNAVDEVFDTGVAQSLEEASENSDQEAETFGGGIGDVFDGVDSEIDNVLGDI